MSMNSRTPLPRSSNSNAARKAGAVGEIVGTLIGVAIIGFVGVSLMAWMLMLAFEGLYNDGNGIGAPLGFWDVWFAAAVLTTLGTAATK